MSKILDIPTLLLGWPFATLWEMYTLDKHYHEPSTKQEQEKAESVLFACIGGMCAIAAMTTLAGWKILLLFGKTAYLLPWWFAALVLVTSIVMYAAGFMTVLNADDGEVDEEPRGPVRLYKLSSVGDAAWVVAIIGINAIAAAFFVLLGLLFWWVVFLSERPRLLQSYGDCIDYRPDVWHAICGGISLCLAAVFLVAALGGVPKCWFGFGVALACYILLSCWYHKKVKENPRWYGWD